MDYLCKGVLHNTLIYLTFDLDLRSSQLWIAPYSDKQHKLYHRIADLRKEGLNYQEIADWLNDTDHKTTRGKTFRNAHVHSIMKKKQIRDERLSRESKMTISNFNIKFEDMTLINAA